MTSTVIGEISRLDLQGLHTPSLASITNVKHLSSYNWIEAPTPTIAVPGCPPLWSALRVPRRLKKDSGLVYIAQNTARHPKSPLEPLFRALYMADPSYDIRSIDVGTDRNNIRKLLSFINPASIRNGLDTFTINIEITKNTAIFCRQEAATHEFIGPQEFRGFGHEFEKANTTNQISGSTRHHRIILYRFGNLSFVVRHETDGYIMLDADIFIHSPKSKEQEKNSLSDLLGSLTLSTTNSPPTTTPAGSKLTIREEGQIVPLKSTLGLKTRISYKPLQFREIVLEVEDVAVEIKRREEDNQNDLRKLAVLISKILEMIKGDSRNAIVKYDDKEDRLVVWRADGETMLPKDLYTKWDDVGRSEDVGAESAVKHIDGVETIADGKENEE